MRDPATAWAGDVVAGRIVAGELVIAACERHLRDLRDGAARGLHWRPERADHALRFFPALLTITEGAKAGQPFVPLPWHSFCIGSLFGWRTTSGRMRFRSAWLETGKGQAKSPLMAAIGLYMMGWYGIPRAKVYAIGQDKNTANVLFKDAVAMCRATIPGGDEGDSLEALGEVVIRGEMDNAWKIERPGGDGQPSIFQALANGDAISGPRPTAVMADEIHEFKSAAPIQIWKEAIAKMPGDAIMLLGTNTPATNQIVGKEYSEFFQRVARSQVVDDEAFAFIARVDPEDHETVFDREDVWVKAMPALGITFPIDNIRGRVNSARHVIADAHSVKRLYFGIEIGASDYWIDEPSWRAVQGAVDEARMKGLPCWLSLDLSMKNDLTALSAAWAEDGDDGGHCAVKTWYWTARVGLEDRARRDLAPYPEYVEQGLLTACPGATIDYTFVAARVAEMVARHDVRALAVDPAFLLRFTEACAEVGLKVWVWQGEGGPRGDGLMIVRHMQGKHVPIARASAHSDGDVAPALNQLCMPHSITALEDRVLKGSITIDASRLTDLCAMNVAMDSDGQGNRCFNKLRSRGRIDGIVTIAMAVGASASRVQAPAAGRSFWDSAEYD